MNFRLPIFAFIILGSSIAVKAQALINVHFDKPDCPLEGAAVLGKEGDKWNFLYPKSGAADLNGVKEPLIDARGNVTDATLTISGFSGPVPFSRSTFMPDLFRVFIYSAQKAPAAFQFSGLKPNVDYRVVVYGNNDQNDRLSDFTVNGHTTTFEADTDETAFSSTVLPSGSYAGNCVVLTAKSDVSGNLDISAMGTNVEMLICGLQIEPADQEHPEPGLGKLATAFFVPHVFTDTDGKKMVYELLLPLGYDKTKKYPLLLFLHSLDETGMDNYNQLTYSRRFSWRVFQDKHPCIVVAPQSPGQNWVNISNELVRSAEPSDPEKMVSKLLDGLQTELSVDPDRIYFTGISAGGWSLWDTITRPPHRYAAGISCSGGGDPTTITAEVAKTPVWIFHSVEDRVSVERPMVAAMIKMGGHPHYTEYNEGLGHVCWNKAFSTPEVMDWLFKQRKGQPATP